MSNDTEQHGLADQVMSHLHRRGRIRPGLRMTPMIDVIFLLLTFFILTAQFDRPEQALPLVFGTAAAGPVLDVMELAIVPDTQGCAVALGGEAAIVISRQNPAAGLAALAERIRRQVSAHDPPPIRLLCDDAVSWELVTKIYDILYGLGARDITFAITE